jgi:hypothetical protein
MRELGFADRVLHPARSKDSAIGRSPAPRFTRRWRRTDLRTSGGTDASRRSPLIRYLFIVEVSDAGDVRRMTLAFRPGDNFALRLEGLEHVVSVVLDHVIGDVVAFGPPLRTGFHVDCGQERAGGFPRGSQRFWLAPIARIWSTHPGRVGCSDGRLAFSFRN